jgi:hypothetical protein
MVSSLCAPQGSAPTALKCDRIGHLVNQKRSKAIMLHLQND